MASSARERPAGWGTGQQKDTRPAEQRTSYGSERDEAEERGHGPPRVGDAAMASGNEGGDFRGELGADASDGG